MTKRPTANTELAAVDDLDDLPEEMQSERPKQTEPGWNGRKTRIKLAHPILRGTVDHPAGRFIDSTTPCLDCQQSGHAFHALASKGSDGVWRGPEADSIATLQRKGFLANTKEARDRSDADRKRRDLIGPEASPVLSAADLERLWKYEMRDGVVNVEIERQIKRDEMAAISSGLATAIEPLVEAIRDKLVASPDSK